MTGRRNLNGHPTTDANDVATALSGSQQPASPTTGGGYGAYVLGMLILVYTFNFIDRQVVGILAVPIKAELGLSDTQLGVMGGTAFALFYTLLGIPIGRLADRTVRTRIIAGALALWSVMTSICGAAHGFWQLFGARVGVGVGEAGGVAPSYSIICDYFPREQRARALAAYGFGIPIGSGIAMLVGGYLATYFGWRTTFLVVGAAGLVLVPIFAFTVREPLRGGLDGGAVTAKVPTTGAVLALLSKKPSFWALALGCSVASMAGYALLFWMPAFLVRSFPVDLLHASRALGLLVFVGGIVGLGLGGIAADRLGRTSKAAYARVPAIAFCLAVPFYVAGVLAPTLGVCIAVLFVPTALGLAWLGPVTSAVQQLVAPNMRATASAIFLFINNMIGLGAGTLLTGALSDALKSHFAGEALRYAIVANTLLYLLAAAILFWAARRLDRDWHA